MFYSYLLLALSYLELTLANNKVQPMFRTENDFVFKKEENHINRPLNPDTVMIVKNISLYEIQNSVNILFILSNKISNL